MAFTNAPQGSDDDLNVLTDINVTPFIDVMLVLLIIFMITAPLSTVNIPVELPSTTKTPQPDMQEPLTVSLKHGGEIYIGDKVIVPSQFSEALKNASHNDLSTRIFLRADKEVNYQALISLMDLLRDAGFLKVSLIGMEKSDRAEVNQQ